MSLSSKSQEKHGYSKTLLEYKSEKIQEKKAKRTDFIIDKDGNKLFVEYFCVVPTEITIHGKANQIVGRDFKRCDYDSFSKRISNCWFF